MRNSSRIAIAVMTAMLVGAMSACSSEGETSETAAGVSAQAQELLDAVYEGVGSDLSDLDPVAAAADVNVYVVSCGQSAASCATNAAAMVEAAEEVGWTATIADGKLSPEGFASAIRQGVAGGADIIIPVGIGCGVAQAAFQEAVDAGVMIVGGGGVDDCDPQLWASERLWMQDVTPQEQWETMGALQADYVWGTLDGGVQAIVLNFTTQTWGGWITDGIASRLDELGGSEVLETIDISDPEAADGSYIQKVTTAVLSHPEANALFVPVDAWLSNGLAAALVSAGVDDQLVVIGRNGDEAVLDMIRQGDAGVDATIGLALDWGGWGSIDTAARVLAGQDVLYIGESMQAVDAEHNLPENGSYQGAVDFRSLFREAWGVQ